MSNLNIKDLKYETAKVMDLNNYNISLKIDGTLIYYIDGELISPRCNRSERFKHILNILKLNNFPNCIGEMFLDEKGSCVFDVSRKENWDKCKFMIFDLIDEKNNYSERKILLSNKINELNNSFIIPIKEFNNFKEGWNYCLNNNSEGLVLRNESNWFKCKLLKEEKIQIVAHEVGKDKGTFILENGSRVSGTSITYVEQFVGIKGRGNKAIAEVEFPFLTKEGKMFQPRLRQIVEVENG